MTFFIILELLVRVVECSRSHPFNNNRADYHMREYSNTQVLPKTTSISKMTSGIQYLSE